MSLSELLLWKLLAKWPVPFTDTLKADPLSWGAVIRYGCLLFRSLPETSKYVCAPWLLHPCKLQIWILQHFFSGLDFQLLDWKRCLLEYMWPIMNYFYRNCMEAEVTFLFTQISNLICFTCWFSLQSFLRVLQIHLKSWNYSCQEKKAFRNFVTFYSYVVTQSKAFSFFFFTKSQPLLTLTVSPNKKTKHTIRVKEFPSQLLLL